jgi:hypothetical protein
MARPWLDLLDDTIRICAQHNRPELVQRLHDRRTQLLDAKLRILVIGEAGQGKSELVNALVNAPVCAVGDGITTTVPAVVEHAEEPSAVVIADQPDTGRRALDAAGSSSRPLPVPVESATAHANREAAAAGGALVHAKVGLPRALLATGLVLIDTPPAGGAPTEHTAVALSQLFNADAVLMVSDATAELSERELDLLVRVAQVCPTVMVALTKIDLVPGWREVADRNRANLTRAGLGAPLVPVSARLRLAAARSGDSDLNAESGFAELVQRIKHEWLDQADLLARRSVAALTNLAVDELGTPLRHEFAETQRSGSGEAVAGWHEAARRLDQLQRESARWQTLLADQVADLVSDLEFDLRDRTRRILREVDEYFDAADPSRTWEDFETWLQDNLASVAETNFTWLIDRFEWIARTIARQVDPGSDELIPQAPSSETLAGHAAGLRTPKIERFSIGQKLFVGMRGSYSGLLMFGLATTVAGMPLINPISLGAGAAFGAKSIFEERGSRLKRRQAVAKTAAQRHVDDFFLSYGKESKDAARRLHRALRDRFSEFTQRRRDDITETAKAFKREIDADVERRGTRAHELKAGLDELTLLRRRVQALGGGSQLARVSKAPTSTASRWLTA